jgi:hypothetical protein
MREVNLEQPFHPLFNYAYITDREEGLILVDVNTLADGEPRNNFLERALTWDADGRLRGARHLAFAGHIAYVVTRDAIAVVDLDNPLAPRLLRSLPLPGAHSVAVQFRYLFATDAQGLRVLDITTPEEPRLLPDSVVRLADAQRLHLARTYAYVAAGREGLAIIDITKPDAISLYSMVSAGIEDARDVTVASTNASLFAYVADGRSGLKVLQLTSPSSQPKFYGFSPAPQAELIARYPTSRPALSISRGLERDRGADESGNQIAVFGRVGSRPLNSEELRRLYVDDEGKPWFVENQ